MADGGCYFKLKGEGCLCINSLFFSLDRKEPKDQGVKSFATILIELPMKSKLAPSTLGLKQWISVEGALNQNGLTQIPSMPLLAILAIWPTLASVIPIFDNRRRDYSPFEGGV